MDIFGFSIKKKNKTAVSKANDLYNNYFFNTLGNTRINWNNVYKNAQNSKKLIQNYNDLTEVSVPINYYADGVAQVDFQVFRKQGEKLIQIENHWIIDLLNNPNFYQNRDEFFMEVAIYRLLLGNNYTAGTVIENIERVTKPTSLFNLPPQYTEIELNNSRYKDIDYRINKVQNYIVKVDGYNIEITIPPEAVLHLKATNPNFDNKQYLFGLSNLVSCHKNIEALNEGYSAKVGLYRHGPRVVITGKQQQPGDMSTMLGSDNIKDIRNKWNSAYGLTEDQFQMLITDVPLDVKMISNNVKSLAINENNISDFQRICGALNIPSVILSDNANSTYNNILEAKDQFYNGPFITFTDSIAKGFTEYFQRFEKDIYIQADYSGISEIVDAQERKHDRLKADTEKGLMTRNDYYAAIGKETVSIAEFDQYYYFNQSSGWQPVTQTQTNETEEDEEVD